MNKLLSAFALVLSNFVFGQGDADLFRYSKTDIQGGARFEAMGGAFGALGADLSSSQINPAGFGRFSNSQITSALGYTNISNSLLYKGITTKTTDNLFKLNTLGFVFVVDESAKQEGFLYSQFGFGYNKLQNYTNSIRYEGSQFESLLDGFAANANGISEGDLFYRQPFSSFLAYWTYAINPTTPGASSYEANLSNTGNQYHKRQVDTKGGMNEYYFSYSTNYLNTLYFGGNIGIRTIRYDESVQHQEQTLDTLGTDMRSFNYDYHLNTRGSGFNLKLGAIYLPQDNIRLGLAFHSATYYTLTDKTDADMVTVLANETNTVPDSLKPFGDYNYRLRTPPKIVGSVAYIFGTHGCISVDVEYVNYRWANLRSTKDVENYQTYDFTNENATAKALLKHALNVRLGGELVLNSIFFVRGGMRFSGNAYNSVIGVETGIDKSYSAGLGYKRGNLAMDISYRYSSVSRKYTAFFNSSAQHDLIGQGLVLSANYVIN
jgi:long-subunit fatty acid transport protein|tara:strand:+ start:4703 stop:6175 length:1473 start_codon:yes stop_codon:yes gene_type:complete